ncbi:MAG: flippase-like domain-containing protein [Candidatus Omnitrophica bacterium]|nr:flippase-like domain-containing protein [Candidatus Omnitrophota bacterium]
MNKTSVKKYIQSIIIFCFLVLIIHYFRGHQEELKLLAKIRISDALLLIGATLGIYYSHATNVLMILRKVGLKGISLYAWFRMFIIARYINFHVTQGRTVYLLYKLKKEHNLSYTQGLSMMVFLSWYYAVTIFIFCFLMLGAFHTNISIKGHNLSAWLFVIIVTTALMPIYLKLILRLPLRHPKLNNFEDRVNSFLQGFQTNLQDKIHLVKLTLYCLIQFILYFFMVYVSFRAIDFNLDMPSLALFTFTLIISKYYSIVPGNIGITEMLCGALTVKMGGELSNGIIVSSLIRIIDYLLVTILGIIFAKSSTPINAEQLQNIKDENPFQKR